MVAPEHILRELADLWVSLGSVPARLHLGPLVVLERRAMTPRRLGETIAALMPEHPARTIVVPIERRGRSAALSERVYAPVLDAVRRAAQICCEPDRDHGFRRGAGRFAIGDVAAGAPGPPGDCVVQERARVRDAAVRCHRADGRQSGGG